MVAVADSICIGMFLFKSLYLTAALYALYLVLATLGYRQWRRVPEERSLPTQIGPPAPDAPTIF
jgi:nicotinamide mononucleotide transporter